MGARQWLDRYRKGKTKMLLTLKNTRQAGIQVKLFDGTGEEIKYAIECDTETGRCVCLARDEAWNEFLHHDGEVLTVTETRSLPIRVELISMRPTCKGDGKCVT